LYIGTNDPRYAEVLVEFPNKEVIGFPKILNIAAGTFEAVRFPSGRDLPSSLADSDDIRVLSEFERNKGIHVKSTNGAELTVIGLSDETASSDAFLAFPCKEFVDSESKTFGIRVNYNYFIYGSEADNKNSR